ncbi:MAG: M28 family peptidase [Candidatus Lokiarchaeota archaeon]
MIDKARIEKNLKNFAFPRLSGTEFEYKAFNKLKQEIENLNLKYKVQNFTFSSFYSRLYPKIAFLSVSIILFLLYLNISIIVSMIIIIPLLGILIASIILTRKPEKIPFIPKYSSQNLLVKMKPRSSKALNNNRVIMFMSHLDSKGQRFKIQDRIKIIKLWVYSSIILLILVILKNLVFIGFELIFYIIGLFPLIFNISSSILMLINTTNNISDGAIDNASGIVCNLELVNYYNNPENRLHNYSMWFLFTGAEECGTMGIRHFYNNNEYLDPKKSIIFNLESIAKHIFLFPGGSEEVHAKNVNNLLINNNRHLK